MGGSRDDRLLSLSPTAAAAAASLSLALSRTQTEPSSETEFTHRLLRNPWTSEPSFRRSSLAHVLLLPRFLLVLLDFDRCPFCGNVPASISILTSIDGINCIPLLHSIQCNPGNLLISPSSSPSSPRLPCLLPLFCSLFCFFLTSTLGSQAESSESVGQE